MDFSNNMNDVKVLVVEKPEMTFPLDKLKQQENWGNNTIEHSDSLGKLEQLESWGKNELELGRLEKLTNNEEENQNSGDVSVEANSSSESNEVREMKCLNQDLRGQEHPVTGVPFVEKIVKDENGEDVKVVVPVFDSKFDAQLPDDKLRSTDREQFKECNKQLKEAVENDPELAGEFTEEQLEQIQNGDTPDGYTWHHHEETGKMQLVDTVIHDKTAHTGGKAIWGGGRGNR